MGLEPRALSEGAVGERCRQAPILNTVTLSAISTVILSTLNTVILSAAGASRSEVPAESKDPLPVSATIDPARRSLDAARALLRGQNKF